MKPPSCSLKTKSPQTARVRGLRCQIARRCANDCPCHKRLSILCQGNFLTEEVVVAILRDVVIPHGMQRFCAKCSDSVQDAADPEQDAAVLCRMQPILRRLREFYPGLRRCCSECGDSVKDAAILRKMRRFCTGRSDPPQDAAILHRIQAILHRMLQF